MNDLDDTLEALDDAVAAALERVFAAEAISGGDDAAVLRAAAITARMQRRLDGLLIEVVGDIDARDSAQPTVNGIVMRSGYRSLNDLLQQVTLASAQAVSAFMRVARAVRRPVGLCTGEFLPPELPALRGALIGGAVGVEGMTAVLGPLRELHCAVGAERMREAEAVLANAVRGTLTDPDEVPGHAAMPPLGGRELRNLARDLVFRLDPDGAEPAEERAVRKRGLSFGIPRDGLPPLRGNLLPDVAGQLQRIFDSLLTPKRTGPRFLGDAASNAASDAASDAEPNTTDAQKQHDGLATALTVAARSGELSAPATAGKSVCATEPQKSGARAAGTCMAPGDPPARAGCDHRFPCGGGEGCMRQGEECVDESVEWMIYRPVMPPRRRNNRCSPTPSPLQYPRQSRESPFRRHARTSPQHSATPETLRPHRRPTTCPRF